MTDWFKIGKGVHQGCKFCHRAYLTYMENTSCEMLGWINHKMESRLPGEISATLICRWYHPNVRKWRGTIESLDEGEREWNNWLQSQHSINKDLGIWSHQFMTNRWGESGSSDRFFLVFSNITVDGDWSHGIKRSFLLGRKVVTNLVQFSRSVMSDSLRLHELQHARPPCPSPTPGVYPNSCPLSQWCHPTILSSVIPFSSCLQCFPTSESFQMSQLVASGG